MCDENAAAFNPRDYLIDDFLMPVTGNIFDLAPSKSDACALWMISGFNGLHPRWTFHFLPTLLGHRIDRLAGDHWDRIEIRGEDRLWLNPRGCLLRITPPLGRMRHLYLFPNPGDEYLAIPGNARNMVMGAVDLLNDLGATVISMNGIHGTDGQGHAKAVDETIKEVMTEALWDWRGQNPDPVVQRIYLVDLKGAFGEAAHGAPANPPNHPSAFSSAMMNAVNQPQANITFELRMIGGPTIQYSCEEFLQPSPVQVNALLPYLEHNPRPKVLDIGCCVGRHLRYIRNICPEADLWATEKDKTLMVYCREHFSRQIYGSWTSIAARDFDVVLLLGNGIGIFGHQGAVRNGLRRAFNALRPGGVLIGEGMQISDRACSEDEFQISFQGVHDLPFRWFHCSSQWVMTLLEEIGFVNIATQPLPAPHHACNAYLIVAEKPQ